MKVSNAQSILLALTLGASTFTSAPLPAAPPAYGTANGWQVTLPEDPTGFSYWTSATAFPAATPGYVEGYSLTGRLLAAHGQKLFLQRAFGSNDFGVVATLGTNMDPSFVKISPDGQWIALGLGFTQPLYVFPTSVLSMSDPLNLDTSSEVSSFSVNYYDAAWRDSRYLFVNGGWTTGSAVYVVDITAPAAQATQTLFDDIPGASGGITFDASGNLVTGIGYHATRTGELAAFPAARINGALAGATTLSYGTDAVVVARNVLSAAHLGFDAGGNLLVGGGDAFGNSGDRGYAAVIDSAVVARVLQGGPILDPNSPAEYAKITPDPCMNDDAVRVLYVETVDMVMVSANLASTPPNCSSMDWTSGSVPQVAHFPPGAPDDDGDGIPNGVDGDYASQAFIDAEWLDALYAAFGALEGDPEYDFAYDLDQDGELGSGDVLIAEDNFGAPRWQ